MNSKLYLARRFRNFTENGNPVGGGGGRDDHLSSSQKPRPLRFLRTTSDDDGKVLRAGFDEHLDFLLTSGVLSVLNL
jgi:hypothetical protein